MAVEEMTTTEIVAAVDEHKRSEKGAGERVVLRGVQVIVLDDLLPVLRTAVEDEIARLGATPAEDASIREAWIPEALEPGSFDAAVEAHAGKSGEQGNKPGRYRAVKKAAWLEKGPRVIEPPIA